MEALRSALFALLLSFLVLTSLPVAIGSPLHAQGSDFYSCTDDQGRTVITNRHYDDRMYRCVPFAELNRVFKEDEARKAREVPQREITRTGSDYQAVAQAVQMSAESARTAMEAARTAAAAADITARAIRTALEPDLIIITPQSSASLVGPNGRFVFFPDRFKR